MNKKYKPLTGGLFFAIWIPTAALMIAATVIAAFSPLALIIMIPTDIFTFYFLVTSLVGYAELREKSLFVKFGFIIKREIPYSKIRDIFKERKFHSETMLSLKNSVEHIIIKYNKFDVICVSVKNNDEFMESLRARIADSQAEL